MSKRFNPLSLDALNFLLADVRGALGPFLNVFLVTQQHWSLVAGWSCNDHQRVIGACTANSHWCRNRRDARQERCDHLGACRAGRRRNHHFCPADFLARAASKQHDRSCGRRIWTCCGRPHTWSLCSKSTRASYGTQFCVRPRGQCWYRNYCGRGWLRLFTASRLSLVPIFAVLSAAAVLSIPAEAIDYDRARDAGEKSDQQNISGYSVLFKTRPLVIFSVCVMLFHFANAPLLPLVGQKLAAAFPETATAMMSSCIVAAQLVMLPMALLVGRKADSWGRKPLFLLGFGILPIRAALYTLSDNSFWLIGVQLLDGIGAGVYGALMPLVVADIMRGTGRYNLALGAIATTQGIGASLSGLASGAVVDHFGYSAGFLTLGAAALVAFVVFAVAMPETAEP